VTKQVFTKITTANRLAAIGEAHPGLALNSLVGVTVHHSGRNPGTVQFTTATDCLQADDGGSPDPATYTYQRTGLNTGTLVITDDSGNGDSDVSTIKLIFTSATGGRFSARNTSSDGVHIENGTFTILQ
jgi:hypothetical protein